MKRFSKWMCGLASGLLAFGLVFALVGWALGGETSMDVTVAGQPITVGINGFHTNSNTWKGEESTIVEDDLAPFDSLDVDVSLGDVDIIPSDHFGLELSWYGKNYELHYENENGKLKVWSASVPSFGVNFGLNYGGKVTIYLPEGTRLSAGTVNTDLGDTNVGGFHADTLEIKAGLGDAAISDVTATDGVVKLSLGDLEMDTVTADQLELILSMGNLSADRLSTEKKLTIENHMGNIAVSGNLAVYTKVDADMGDVTLITGLPERDYGYDLKTSMGTVRVNGNKQEDKANKKGGEHRIIVDNSMGDIDVDFN